MMQPLLPPRVVGNTTEPVERKKGSQQLVIHASKMETCAVILHEYAPTLQRVNAPVVPRV